MKLGWHMSLNQQYVELPGSHRAEMPGARKIGLLDPNEQVQVSVYLKSRSPSPVGEKIAQEMPYQRQHLSREEYLQRHGAHADDFAKVEEFARKHGLEIVKKNVARRVIKLVGTSNVISHAFGVVLHCYEHTGGIYRGRTGAVKVPQELSVIIEAVLGLDNRPQAQPHFKSMDATPNSFDAIKVASVYKFPQLGTASGQCIGIIELGGGYIDSDLQTYFQQLGISSPPQVLSVSVDGATNSPTGDTKSADGEVALDIQIVGAVAPGAKIVVYFAHNTDQGFTNAITAAIHDTTNRPSVISISWGASESKWTDQAMRTMNQAFRDAAILGVTICCSSGDNGVNDRVGDGKVHVEFPATSPNVLACGGTTLNADSSETAWNNGNGWATGGGISDKFPLPEYQVKARIPSSLNNNRVGRGIPDIAGNADPQTGYQVLVNGQQSVMGGTSAVAPLWAGLIALINEQIGHPVGFLNPFLYQNPNLLRDISVGNNSADKVKGYDAALGWDACTGLGTPDGGKLLNLCSKLKSTMIKSQGTNLSSSIGGAINDVLKVVGRWLKV